MRMRVYRFALFAVLLASFVMVQAPQSAYACSCEPFDPEVRFPIADAVFRGRVVHADYAPASPMWAGAPSNVQTGFLVEVKDIHKGQVPSRVYFAYHYSWMCSGPPPFSVGSEYLFYSHRTSCPWQTREAITPIFWACTPRSGPFRSGWWRTR
jgi:hypothetical protein